MNCQELRDMYELYALGVLEGGERAEIEEHLGRGCETCRRGLADAVKAQTDHEFSAQSWLSKTEDHAEGIRAVAERRVGRFSGR